jgi:hypothetical protein
MIENKPFKHNLGMNNKMSDTNINMEFRDLPTFSKSLKSSLFTSEEKHLPNLMRPDIQNTFYEWITYKSKVKPYYDIDGFYKTKEEYEKKQIEVINKAKEGLKKLYPKGKISISSSCGKKVNIKTKNKNKVLTKGFAISYHFVVNGYETTPNALEEFNEINKVCDFIEGYDKSVYSDGQNFRLLYSYKPNDKRQKVPVTKKKDPYTHIIQSNKLTNFEINKLPQPVSPTVTPPQSPEVSDNEEIEEDLPPLQPEVIVPKKIEIIELEKMIDILIGKEELYEYEEWIKIGLAIHNMTDGNEEGKELFIKFSDGDEDEADLDNIASNWEYWTKTKNKQKNKVGYTFIKKLYEKYRPIRDQTLESVFKRNIDEDRPERINGAKLEMLKFLNTKLMFVKATGDFIILDNKQSTKENGEVVNKECWILKTTTKVKDHFSKENFTYWYELVTPDGERIQQKKDINPFKLWMDWIDRREVSEIGFDPRNKCDDIFNLWNGFSISKEEADESNEEDAKPILDHIKELWCKNNEETYNYILNLFSHYIQKPHIKTGVLLALKSKQGGGKGIILNKLHKIIGDDHYIQNSNAEYLFGNFNGQLEGKIVCNLDEALWGGDKKKEGMMKNKITESSQQINKKNKEIYSVDDYVNYIITTNNDWFAGVTEDDRRHYCLELDNKLSGRMTEDTIHSVQPVIDAPAEAFAKVLYNRDISDFKPRVFKKTKLLQDQVERGWTSVKRWYNSVMKDGGFTYNHKGDQLFIEWNTLLTDPEYGNKIGGVKVKNKNTKEKQTAYCKDWLFECYNQAPSDNKKFSKESFYRDLKKNCIREDTNLLQDKKLQIKKQRKPYLFLPCIEDARKEWYDQQEYDYEYDLEEDDEWVVDDCDLDSDDEE